MTFVVKELPPVSATQKDAVLEAERTSQAHRALLADTDTMNILEVNGESRSGLKALPESFTVAAWNMERCLFPEASAELLRVYDPQVVLLSEVDNGMSRTGQRNTTAAMAKELGMVYAYGVEFLELDLGGPSERRFCKDDFNALGFHGNAILSAVPFERVELLRLDDHGHWFVVEEGGSHDADQPRLGGRMAILATVPTEKGPVCMVSTHLESNADAAHRLKQYKRLLDAVDRFAPDVPVLIGGDLNTGNHLPPNFDWRDETLFSQAQDRGYSWDLSPDGMTTRPSLITAHPTRRMKLDWFCSRDLQGERGEVVPALDPEGTPLSDHECVVATMQFSD